ncbi:MAG: AMIN domain-containing protein [Desulfobulbus sp.]|jgi:hypothetical protein|nr:AMIN domain-containing protein [Desulfobulbus sp.]
MKTPTLALICPPLLALLLICGLAAAEVRPQLSELRFSAVAPGSEKVVLQLNGSYSPKVFTMKGETPRIVLDFADMTHSGKVSPLTVVNGALVQRIRVGMHPGDAPKTRVVLDLATFAGVSFDQRFDPAASTLTIELTSKGKGATPATSTVTARKEPAPEKKTQAAARTTPAAKVAAAAPNAAAAKAAKPTAPPADTAKTGTATGPVSGAPAATEKEAAAKPAEPVPPAEAKPAPTAAEPEPPAVTGAAGTPAAAVDQPAVMATAADKAATPAAAKGAAATGDDKPAQTAAASQPQAAADDKAVVPAEPTGPVLESVTFDGKSPKGEMVLFKLTEFHPPEVHGVEQGVPRVICDFKGTRLADSAQNLIKTDGKHVKVIRVSKTRNPEKVRVVLDLVPNRSYDLQQVFFKEDNLFVIIVNTVKN